MKIKDYNSSFYNIKSNAFWYNSHIDTLYKPGNRAIIDTITHLNDCKTNPTIGLLARRQSKTDFYPEFQNRNKELLINNPKIKNLNDSFEKEFKELYPKTAKIRKYLIDNEFVILDYIKPKTQSFSKKLFRLFLK